MRGKTVIAGLGALLLTASIAGTASAGPSKQSLNQYVAQARSEGLIKKVDARKAKDLGISVCKSSAASPTVYWPSVTNRAISNERVDAWYADRELKVNKRTMRRLIRLALDTACPRTLITFEMPPGGWQEQESHNFGTVYQARASEGALFPLGNAWQLGGELEGYVSSGQWYEGAYFTIEMLDANLQPVTRNYVGLGSSDSKDVEIDPNRPYSDIDIIQDDTTWIGGYSPGSEYSASGSGSGSERLAPWANARFARVESLTGTESVLFTLTVEPSRWVPTQ